MSKATGTKSATKAGSVSKGPKRQGEPVNLTTPDFLAEQVEQFRALMPHVFTEEKVDVEKLRAALGGSVDERSEADEIIFTSGPILLYWPWMGGVEWPNLEAGDEAQPFESVDCSIAAGTAGRLRHHHHNGSWRQL